ncbi:MAG: hypothetical protein BGO01_01775 [Armatimonadetes bacterium 55-13]|nr:hypothetical protein [Armatimonadota bacterium]OJU65669.1 MAG: hypothetical protein BGO01_01775 [Armatimonadetes bacterium 55-13]
MTKTNSNFGRAFAKARNRQQGSVVLTTLITLMFVMTMGIALLSLTMQGLSQTRRIKASTNAFNLAESGLDRATRWFKELGYPPTYTSEFYPIGGTVTTSEGKYTVVAYPDAGNAGAVLKKFIIVSTGVADGRTEKIQLVIRQSSFGKYAYFTDKETSSVSGGRIWFYGGDHIRGPAHSNNKNGSEFQVNWGSSTSPIFEDTVTSVGDFITYSPSNPSTESQFAKIYRAGSRGYELGVDEIPLPDSSDAQKQAAWGPNGSYPSTNGVYTPSGGGIYIRGDASITMQVDAYGRQQFVIVQGTKTTTLTVDKANDVMYQKVNSGATTTIPGSGNGMVYSTGNITSLSGTIADNIVSGSPASVAARSAYTIATDVNNNKNITLTSTLKHKTAFNPDLAPNDAANLYSGTVGLIGRNVTIASGAPKNMEIDAVILAGSSSTSDGSFSVADYNTKTPTGTLKVLGGIIQKARGAVGTLSGSNLATGYAKDYYYDARMADNPPPFFPTTGGYDKVSWRRILDNN